jgi:predicted extracellular nuclease
LEFRFGFWYLAPLTAPTVVVKPVYNPPASPFTPEEDECSLLVGAYNVENMNPKSKHIPTVAKHIVEFLKTPDVMLLQEIQDNNGETDDGTVSANLTLATLATAIVTAGGKFNYSFVDIAPVNDQDGGAPGGNIRTAYLYNPAKVSLVPGRAGGALEATEVVVDSAGNVGLSLNPGRIEPTSEAWNSSRKPLVANWQTVSGERFFTIDVHFASKGGSSSGQGDARPPVNGVVGPRTNQVTLTANFMKSILAADKDASILVGGDMNEYIQTRSVFKPFEGVVQDLDAVAGIPEVERYSYTFDQNTQELDHTFVSAAIAARKPKFEHIHVNTWSPSYKERTSDHDPSVASIKVCTNLQKYTGALGGIYAPAVTKRGNRYYTKGEASLLLVTARTRSCNRQLSACTTLSKTGAVKWTGCVAQEAKCLAAMVF